MPDLAPGDVVATNDPYAGGGTHLCDVALVRPIFFRDRIVAFAAAKGHWSEVGGKDPGSWTADSTEIFQEGLQLPFVRMVRGGVRDRDIEAILATNSRLPDMVTGDLVAQAACLEVAERRMVELCERYGADTVAEAMRAEHVRSERLARASLASLPHGTYEAEDFLDDDGVGGGPIPIRVKVTLAPDEVVVDFTGSSSQVRGPVNCTWSGLVSGVRTVFKAITDPTEPPSDAWFRPLRIVGAGRLRLQRDPAGAGRRLLRGDRGGQRPGVEGARAGDPPAHGRLVRVRVRHLAGARPSGHRRADDPERAAAWRLGRERHARRRARPGLGRRRRDLRDPGRGLRTALRRARGALRAGHRGRRGRRAAPRRARASCASTGSCPTRPG